MELDYPLTKVSQCRGTVRSSIPRGASRYAPASSGSTPRRGSASYHRPTAHPTRSCMFPCLHRAGLQELGEQAELICEIGHGPKGPAGHAHHRNVEQRGVAAPQPRGMARSRARGRNVRHWSNGSSPTRASASSRRTIRARTCSSIKACCAVPASMCWKPGQRVQMRVQDVEKGREATWVMPL